ncbi:MAG: hypothetical protein HKP27_02175, partial [Myxococcales bacterium]|nr:hypothetical protein [Myxococcales bacterium]
AGPERAAARAAKLLAELAAGTPAPAATIAQGAALPEPPVVRVSAARVNRLLGTSLAVDAMQELLARQDFSVEVVGDELVCHAPSHRNDIAIAEDIVEEIARIHGYDEIAPSLPSAVPAGVTEPPLRRTAEGLRDALRASGLVEIMTFSAGRRADLSDLRLKEDDERRRVVALVNPIKAEEPILRSTLVASALRAVEQNLARQLPGVAIFELGRVFLDTEPTELPEERNVAVAALAGTFGTRLWKENAPLFFRLKGIVGRALAELGVVAHFRPGCDEPFLHPGVAGHYRAGKKTVAWIGEVHPETAARFDLEGTVALAGFDLDTLGGAARPAPKLREVSKFPSASRDFAVLLGSDVAAGDVLAAVRKSAGSSLADVEVFDRYEGKGVPEGKLSLGLRLTFQLVDRTLTDAELVKACDRVVATLASKFGGELR